MATAAQPEPEPEPSPAVTLDSIAAEIAKAEELLSADIARDIAAVQSGTLEFAAREGLFTEDERTQLLGRIMAERHQQDPEAQPGGAWEDADTTAPAPSTMRSAAPAGGGQAQDDGSGAQHDRPARPRPSAKPGRPQPGEPRRRPSSAPPRKLHLPGDGAPDRRYRPSRQDLERQAREKQDRECTFKPNSSRQRTRPATAHASMTRQERIDNLAKSKLNLWRKREQQRIEIAEKEAKQCTFEPKVGATKKGGSAERSDDSHARESGGASASVADRLYHEADGRLANRQRLKREKEAAELTRLQFAPTLNSTSTATTGVLPNLPPARR